LALFIGRKLNLKDAWEGQRSLRFLTVKRSSCCRVVL